MSEFLDIWEKSVVTGEDINGVKAEGLLPTNWYEGQIQTVEGRIVDKTDNVLFGKTVAHCAVDLYTDDGKTKKFWFDALPDQIRSTTGRLTSASKNGAYLATATGTVGKSFKDTMTQAMQSRLKFRISLAEGKNGQSAKNWLNEIKAA